MNSLLFIIWFFLPAGLANTAPIFAAHLPVLKAWNTPLDFGSQLNGKRILGDHKTIRGLIAGIVIGIFIAWVEQLLYSPFSIFHFFVPQSFAHLNPILFGTLSALGALIGDSIKSFFKRQLSIPSGRSWFPFDQIDYIIGGILFTLPIYQLTIWQYVLLLIVWFVLHPAATVLGYLLKLKKDPI